MSNVRVKICGITSIEDLHISVEAGADAVGFIVGVPQSPRNLEIAKVKKLIQATPIFVETVAVTVLENMSQLCKTIDELNPDIVQIHGLIDIRVKEIRELFPRTLLIAAVKGTADLNLDTELKAIDRFDAVLADSYVKGKYGGTGITHDWEISKKIREKIYPKPFILAGGLDTENVKESIKKVRPYAVDVSTGVESSLGVKNRKKVIQFVRKVKEVE